MSRIHNKWIKGFFDIRKMDDGTFRFKIESTQLNRNNPFGLREIPCKYIDDIAKERLLKQWNEESMMTHVKQG